MIPFNPFSPFPYLPFGVVPPGAFGNAPRIGRLDTGGIYELCTNAVQLSEESVDFGINPCQYNALPAESLILLKIRNSVPDGADGAPVTVVTPSSGQSTVSGSSAGSGVTKTPLVDHNGTQVTGSDITNPTEVWAYLNKCTGTLRILSYAAAPTPVASAAVAAQEAAAAPTVSASKVAK